MEGVLCCVDMGAGSLRKEGQVRQILGRGLPQVDPMEGIRQTDAVVVDGDQGVCPDEVAGVHDVFGRLNSSFDEAWLKEKEDHFFVCLYTR